MDQDKLSAAKLAAEELSLEDLRALRQWITLEREPKLEAAPFVAQEQAQVIRDLRAQGVVPRPEATTVDAAQEAFREDPKKAAAKIPAWVDPEGKAALMYEEGDVVAREGAMFLSRLAGLNGDTPGESATWDDVTEMLLTADFDPSEEG